MEIEEGCIFFRCCVILEMFVFNYYDWVFVDVMFKVKGYVKLCIW